MGHGLESCKLELMPPCLRFSTSMMFRQLLRVCVKKFIFLARTLDTFSFKMPVTKCKVGLSKPEKLFLIVRKVNCGLLSPGIVWF